MSKEEKLVNLRGLQLHLRTWDARGPARAIVLAVHGFSWHSAYFEELAAALNAAGMLVAAFDLQGHGLSATMDGLRGHADRFDHFVDDAELFLDHFYSRSGPPVFMLGESMGGTIVLHLLRRPAALDKVKGLILLAPVVRVAAEVLPPAPLLLLLRLLALLFPRMKVPANNLDRTFDEAFGDASRARAARADPLVVMEPPCLRMVVEVLGACRRLSIAMEEERVAMLVLHGDKDVRTELRNSEELLQRSSARDKTLRVVPNGHHQLLQDLPGVTRDVIDAIVTWLEERC